MTPPQKKILIIAPSWVGDLVMAQALFRLLKKQDPDCSIDVFANKSLHPLLEHMPEVDNCLTSPFEHGELKLLERFRLAKKLRENSYTHAYVLPNSLKSALIPFWANIPVRTGWRGEFRYILLNNIKLSVAKIPSVAERFAALGVRLSNPLPLPRLHVSQEKLNIVLNKLGIVAPQKPILALCPGTARGTSKCWPAAHFAEVAKVKKSEGWDVWIFGNSNEKTLAQEIQTQNSNACLDLTGKTTLGEAIDLLSLAAVVVANDSGLMHIAAALNRPTVAIYGPTPPTLAPPLTDKRRILSLNLPCSPCFKGECPLKHTKCMYDLQPGLVLQAISELAR